MDSYLPHAGYVQFPRRPDDLTSAVCPACFSPRGAGACPTCGLDLASPLVAELDAAGTDAAASLERRLEFIGRIRYESSLAAAPPFATAAPIVEAPTLVEARPLVAARLSKRPLPSPPPGPRAATSACR